MTKEELIDWALARGWTLDRYGHLQRTFGERRVRLKLSAVAVRYEVRSGSDWVRVMSGYYKDLRITPEGKLAGLKRGCCGS